MWPGDHDNDDNDDDMFPMLWQARDSLMMFSLSCRDKWAAGNSRHMAPFIATWSQREREPISGRSVPRSGPGTSGGCWLVEDDHVTSILASDWLMMVEEKMGVTPHGVDNVIVDVIGGWKHTLSIFHCHQYLVSCCYIENTTQITARLFTSPHMCFPDISQTNNKCADCLHPTRGPNNKADGPPVRILSAW